MLFLLFCCIATTGLVLPNATAAAMAPYHWQAGSASALLGVMQSIIGAGAGALVSVLHNGTALPMAGTIALGGVAAFLSLHLLAFRPLPQEARQALEVTVPFPPRLGRPPEFAKLALSIVENPMLNGETIRLDGALRMAPK